MLFRHVMTNIKYSRGAATNRLFILILVKLSFLIDDTLMCVNEHIFEVSVHVYR